MADSTDPTAAGLLVLNGDAPGRHIRMKLPVLVIGSSPTADLRLLEDGIADIHCLLCITPTGPAIRAFDSHSNSLNGTATAAAMVKDGDELTIGKSRFRIVWPSSIPKAEPNAEVLLAQLSIGREQLRREKAAAKEKLRDADHLHRERTRLHARTRSAAKRYLAAHQDHVTQEQKAIAAAREELATGRDRLAAAVATLSADHAHLRSDADDYNRRLAIAWQAVSDAQTTVADDRRRMEQELAAQFQQHDIRRSELVAREAAVKTERAETDRHVASLHADIAGLEQRAATAQSAIQELIHKRNEFITAQAAASENEWLIPVPLDGRGDSRSAQEIIAGLHRHEQELLAERRAAANAKAEADRDREQIADQRALLNDQFARLAEVRSQWQRAEVHTVEDLEDLARELAHREALLDARTAAAERGDIARQQRDEQLVAFRRTLDGWQSALAAQESRFATERQYSEIDLTNRRGNLADREASVEQFFKTWDETYTAACTEMHEMCERHVAESVAMRVAIVNCDHSRSEALADVAKLAARDMARTETIATHDPKAERRLMVLQKRWESRFTRMRKEIDARRQKEERASVRLTAHTQALHESQKDWAATQAAHLKATRTMLVPMNEEPIILSLADARRELADRELAEYRHCIAGMAEELEQNEPADVIPLRRAG